MRTFIKLAMISFLVLTTPQSKADLSNRQPFSPPVLVIRSRSAFGSTVDDNGVERSGTRLGSGRGGSGALPHPPTRICRKLLVGTAKW